MKKLLLGLFLIGSVLTFTAERVVKMENAYVDDKGIVYIIGEKTPFTGIVEFKYENGKIQGLMGVKNGVLDVQSDDFEKGDK